MWMTFLGSPWPIAAASSVGYRSSFDVALVYPLTNAFASTSFVPVWLVAVVSPYLTSETGLPSVSMVVPMLIPLVVASTPVGNVPLTSYALPRAYFFYYALSAQSRAKRSDT